MKLADIKNDLLRRAFRLKARWQNFEHPAFPKLLRDRHIDLTREFFVTTPPFGSIGQEVLRSIMRSLDNMAQDKNVLATCQFALEQFKQSEQRVPYSYEEPASKLVYENHILEWIATKIRYLSSLEANESFKPPNVKRVYESFREGEKLREADQQKSAVFKVNRTLRIDNEAIEYFKKVDGFLDDFIEVLNTYEVQDVGLYIDHMAMVRIANELSWRIKEQLAYLDEAEVVSIDKSPKGPDNPART